MILIKGDFELCTQDRITISHINIVDSSLDCDHYHKIHLSITKTKNYNINLWYKFHTKTFNNYINILKYLALSIHT